MRRRSGAAGLRLALCALAVGAASQAAAQAPNLDGLLAFQSPKNCLFGERLQAVFRRMEAAAVGDPHAAPDPIVVPEIGEPLRGSVSSQPNLEIDGVNVSEGRAYTLPLRGRWLGLHVVNLSFEAGKETSVYRWRIVFSDAPAVVRARLNQAGFALPRTGHYRATPTTGNDLGIGEPLTVGISLEVVPHGAALSCSTTIHY